MTEPSPVRKDDWITQLLDKLDEFIEFVRSKTTEPLAKVARYLVYLVLFVVLGIALTTLLFITIMRALSYLPGEMWTVYAGISVFSLLLGTFFWRKAARATR
jgi:hypothetical protein